MQKNKNIFILGAGPTGLSIAWHLSKSENNINIIEKKDYVGGLSRTICDGKYLFDLGPHNIHTNKTDIINFLYKILNSDLMEINFKVKIYFNNQFVDYPLKGVRTLKVLSIKDRIRALFDFLIARCLMFIRNPKDDESFKSWITNRFGRTLYNIYFGPYAEKAWKIQSDKISAYVAQKRVPIISLTDYIRKLIKMNTTKFHPEDSSQVRCFYPKYGIQQVTNYFYNKIKDKNCIISLSSTIESIEHDDFSIKKIQYASNNKENIKDVDFLFSTIPINELVLLLRPLPSEDVMQAAKKLDFCSGRLLYLKCSQEEILQSPVIYFQNPNIKFNRIYDLRRFSKYCVPEGKNAVCVEFTCFINDEIWNASDEELFSYTIEELEKRGILKNEIVEGCFSERLSHTYPRFRIGFQKKLRTIFSYLEKFRNLVTLGRQGLFCYANIDEVLHMSFRAMEYFNTIEYKNIDYDSLFQEYIKHD